MVDIYTKSVLAVIAAALAVIAVQMTITPTRAQQNDLQRVVICDVRANCLRFDAIIGERA